MAASSCSQIPVQLVVSHGMQQLKRLTCNVTCRTLEHRRQFTIELKLGSPLRPLVKPWSRIMGRPAVKRQRPKRFQLRFKPTTLPQQLRLPVSGLQREGHPSEQVLEEQVPLGSSEPAGPHLDKPEEAGRRLKEKPMKRRCLEGAPEEAPRRRGRPRNIDDSPGDSFKCSACGKLFTCRKEASHHILHAHYNLARLNDERPLSEQEVRTALRRAAESLDQLVCDSCRGAFKTYMSFYVHRSHCTSTEQKAGYQQESRSSRKRTNKAAAEKSFTCSACKCVFGSKQDADTHILHIHYNMARINDDRPLTVPEVVTALKQIENRFQRFDCHQPGCSHHAATASEYLQHLNTCGPYVGQIPEGQAIGEKSVGTKDQRETQGASLGKRKGARDASVPKKVKRVPCFKINVDFPDGTVLVCSGCHKSFTCKEAVTKHVLTAHYNLARVNDERPLSLEEMRSALRQASLSISRFECLERGCKASFASYMSYYAHLSHCGPLAKLFSRGSNEPVQVVRPSLNHVQDSSKKGKRSSALRALASFQVLEGTVDNLETIVSEDSDFAPSDAEDEQDYDSWDDDLMVCEEDRPAVEAPLVILQRAWQGRYEAPQQPTARIDPKLVASWAEALANNACIECPNQGCPKIFSTVPGLQYHFRRCRLMQLYRCLNCCEATFARPKTLLDHLRICYPERPEGDQPRRFSEVPCGHRRSVVSAALPSLRLPAQLPTTMGPMLHHVAQHMRHVQRQSQCWKETLYPGWMPSGWQLLDQPHREACLPRFRESPALRSHCAGQATTQEWQRLPLFGCLSPSSGDSHVTFYPGGAIWAAAWCPLPPDRKQRSPHEWVALSCCPNPDKEHPLTDAVAEPGLLQIWDLGPLQLNRNPCGMSPPQLGLCLAHDFGFVAGLDWCPSGCHQQGSRLGLLALACGDGCARILSIPDPDGLPPAQAPMYRVDSECQLLRIPPGPLGAVPCTRVAWDVARKHHHIALGFSDGRVAVFGVGREEEPLWVWQAHQGAITGLGWTPQGHVCTAAIDHAARVWDLHRPGLVPVSAIVKNPARQMALSPHWNGLFVVGEESAIGGPAHSLFRENGYYGYTPKTLVPHYATVWGVTVSPWSNVVASCDASGKVAAICLPYLSANLDFLKNHTKTRLPLFRAVLVPLGEEQGKGPTQQGGHSLANKQYGISFEDIPLDEESSCIQPAHSEKNNSCGQYQLNSFNTVCWSPNRSSANWLFSAGQAGVARLTWLGLYGQSLEDATS